MAMPRLAPRNTAFERAISHDFMPARGNDERYEYLTMLAGLLLPDSDLPDARPYSRRLFVVMLDHYLTDHMGQALTAQRFSKWITDSVHVYEHRAIANGNGKEGAIELLAMLNKCTAQTRYPLYSNAQIPGTIDEKLMGFLETPRTGA